MIYENEIHPPQVPQYHVTPDGAEVAISQASFPKPFHIGLQVCFASPGPLDHCPFAHAHPWLPRSLRLLCLLPSRRRLVG